MKRTDRQRFSRAVAEQRAREAEKLPLQLERLKQAREVRMLSKGELAIACGGLPVGSYENETLAPDSVALKRIAVALGFPVHFFTRPPTRDGFIRIDGDHWNTLGSHLALRCPCGMDDCGYWCPDLETVIEPCKYGGKPPSCGWCERKATHLCDGKARYDRDDGKTCDQRMCTHHRKRIGPRMDVCPGCAKKPEFAQT